MAQMKEKKEKELLIIIRSFITHSLYYKKYQVEYFYGKKYNLAMTTDAEIE